MAGFPKVLTVSYGTLTCRLEGFEDSPGAMAAVGEFVRELVTRAPRVGAPGEGAGGGPAMPPPSMGPGTERGSEPRAEAGVEAEMDEFEAALLGGTGATEWMEESGEEASEFQAMKGTAALWAGAFEEPEDAPFPAHARRSAWADEAAVSRLMGHADARLAEPEALRRRAALAQLRAAVAATEAARRLGEPRSEEGWRQEPFRGDLRHAVDARGTRPGRLAAAGPASLTLVTSRPGGAPLPGTAASDGPSGEHDAGAFGAFADRAGVATLADLLEAAAAFACLVEGAEGFSRPQLMARARQAGRVPVTREDELRAFGELLRQGSIVRVRGGRYRVGADTRFDPARRGPGAGR